MDKELLEYCQEYYNTTRNRTDVVFINLQQFHSEIGIEASDVIKVYEEEGEFGPTSHLNKKY